CEAVDGAAARRFTAFRTTRSGCSRAERAPKFYPVTIGVRRSVMPGWAAIRGAGRLEFPDGSMSVSGLKRSELAALLWATLGFNRDGTRNRFRINRHLARFILVGFYTGTRHDAILKLQWQANTVGGCFDIDAGILYRRPQDAIETN